MTSPKLVLRHVRDAMGDDPRVALAAIRELQGTDLPWLEERAVRMARARGTNWARIGRLLHRSRQAVRQRYAWVDGTAQPLPRLLVDEGAAVVARLRRSHADSARWAELDRWAESGDIVPW